MGADGLVALRVNDQLASSWLVLLSFFFFQFTWGEVFFFLFGCFPHAETATFDRTQLHLTFSVTIYIKPLVEALNDLCSCATCGRPLMLC